MDKPVFYIKSMEKTRDFDFFSIILPPSHRGRRSRKSSNSMQDDNGSDTIQDGLGLGMVAMIFSVRLFNFQ